MEIKRVEFFIDTYRNEAFHHIMETISILNDVKETRSGRGTDYSIDVLRIHSEDEEIKYLSLRGSWDAYNVFLQANTHKVDLSLPENYKYHYSLTHYEED